MSRLDGYSVQRLRRLAIDCADRLKANKAEIEKTRSAVRSQERELSWLSITFIGDGIVLIMGILGSSMSAGLTLAFSVYGGAKLIIDGVKMTQLNGHLLNPRRETDRLLGESRAVTDLLREIEDEIRGRLAQL